MTAVVLGGLALYGCQSGKPGPVASSGPAASPGPASPGAGAEKPKAPDFALPIVHGGTFRLSDQRDKHPVLVNFFSTTWGACNAEFPHLQEVYEQYKDKGLQVVSISTEDEATLRAFQRHKGTTFPILRDGDGSVYTLYQAEYVPASMVVAPDGRVVGGTVGYDPDDFAQNVIAPIKSLLEKQAQR
jgi:peroxiredoxin